MLEAIKINPVNSEVDIDRAIQLMHGVEHSKTILKPNDIPATKIFLHKSENCLILQIVLPFTPENFDLGAYENKLIQAAYLATRVIYKNNWTKLAGKIINGVTLPAKYGLLIKDWIIAHWQANKPVRLGISYIYNWNNLPKDYQWENPTENELGKLPRS